MDLGLKNQTVLVTGSSTGIGKATAIAYGREGACVGVTYHTNRDGAEETAAAVEEAGGEALVTQFDLGSAESIRASIEAVKSKWGTLNVLVNNAVDSSGAKRFNEAFEDVPFEVWQTMLRTSLEGVVATLYAAVPLMRTSGWGRIINVSSDGAEIGVPGLGPYASAKSGLYGLTRTLAHELGPANILSNIVMPGSVLTERNQQQIPPEIQQQIAKRTPTQHITTPEEVANVIVFLGSQANRQVNGEIIRVTGGV